MRQTRNIPSESPIDCFLEGLTCTGSSRLAVELGRRVFQLGYVYAQGVVVVLVVVVVVVTMVIMCVISVTSSSWTEDQSTSWRYNSR